MGASAVDMGASAVDMVPPFWTVKGSFSGMGGRKSFSHDFFCIHSAFTVKPL